MHSKLSFVTNATYQDGLRLNTFIPAVLNVYGDTLDELIVIVDRMPEEGRIRELHGEYDSKQISLEYITRKYTSTVVRFMDLDYSKLDEVSFRWFGRNGVNRCQNGTPIFAFLFGIEQCRNQHIIRSDCDILFYDKGFINAVVSFSSNYDVVQLPFLNNKSIPFSTRCFYINKNRIFDLVPISLIKLDAFRRIHRWIMGRSSFLALEQILDASMKKGVIKCHSLDTSYGYTMHIPKRSDFDNIEYVLDYFFKGQIPSSQLEVKHDYNIAFWKKG